jgi:Rrf2 family protein
VIFSKKCEYAIKALIYLSLESRADKKLGVKQIAEHTDSPVPFTSKILQELAHFKIVSSSKGAAGGFYLNELQKHISLSDVIEIIDGKELFEKCGLGLKKCSSVNPCPIHHELKAYAGQLKMLLSSKTIADLAQGVEIGINFIKD